MHVSRGGGAGGQHSQTRGHLFPGTEKGPPAQPSQARPLVSRGPARGLGMQRGHEAIGPSEGPQGAPSPPSPSCHLSSLDHPGAGAPRTPPSGLRPPDDPACTPRPLSGPHPGPAAGHVACGPEPLTAPRGTETPTTAQGRQGLEPQAPGACRTRPAVTERPAPRRPHTAAVLPSWLHPQDGRLRSPASPGEEAAVPAMRAGASVGSGRGLRQAGPLTQPPSDLWPHPRRPGRTQAAEGIKVTSSPCPCLQPSGLQHLPHPHPWVLRRTSPGAGAWSPPRLPPGSPGSVWHLFLWRSPPRCVGEPACLDPHGGPQRGARGLAGPACVSAAVSSS